MRRAEHHRLRPIRHLAAHVVQVGVVLGERARDDAGAGERRPERVRLEGGLRHDHLVAGLEGRRRDERDQLVRAVADDELVGPDAEAPRQSLAQGGRAAVGIEVHARRLARDSGHGPWRGAEGVLVGREPDEVGPPELFGEPLERRARVVGGKRVEDRPPESSHAVILVSLHRI